jgi:hypothetical protein
MPQTCPGSSVVSGVPVRPRRWRLALLVSLAFCFGMAARVPAATTWTVCASGCDDPSIKAAIAASTAIDGDTLAIAAGTYTEPGITVSKSLTLQGEGTASTIVQAAEAPNTASHRVFSIARGVTATLQALTIRYGKKGDDEGGAGIWNDGTLTLLKSVIRRNKTRDVGGGLYNTGTLTVTASLVSQNFAKFGGGLTNCGTLMLTSSTVSDNFASSVGGGLHNTGRLRLIASTVNGNSASGGGGLANYGTLSLSASTVTGNSATFYGGGLGNFVSGGLTLTGSTVSGNTAESGGGLHNVHTLTLTSSIVANNPIGRDCNLYSGAITSKGYNFDSDTSCRLAAPTDRSGADPRLGPLQDNGGPTFTQALLPGSPALDAMPWGTNGCGTTLYSDQRWQARPEAGGGACDIGAYERTEAGQPLGAWVTGFTPHTVTCKNVTTGQQVTLSNPATFWDCEGAGLGVTAGDRVSLLVRGPVKNGATDIGGAVVGMTPNGGGCSNRTTGQQVTFQHMPGATAASCVAAGLVVHPRDTVQMQVQGAAE